MPLEAQELTMAQNLANIRHQISQLQVFIQALEPMLVQQQTQHLENMGLADLCRAALGAYQGQWLTAQDVRSYIEQLGIGFEYQNVMAVLHNTLARVGRKDRNGLSTVYARR